MFTTVNGKRIMSIHNTHLADHTSDQDSPGTSARAYPGIRPEKPAALFCGIRGAGQYCRCQAPAGAYQRKNTPRVISGIVFFRDMGL
jgi:hypothetical protein